MAKISRVLSSLVFAVLSLSMTVNAAGVPAIFIFGDSTADVGTNNYIQTIAKADCLYNGIDFPGGSKQTGRFSNGLNCADSLAQKLGFGGSPPPFLQLMSQPFDVHRHILRGANFASGGSGLSDQTGTTFGQVIPFRNQTQQFSTVHTMLTDQFGKARTDYLISKSLFILSVGSNDLFEYDSILGTWLSAEFIAILKSVYEYHLKTLYSLGARKFGIISPPPIGCCPSQRVKNTTVDGGCLEGLNELSRKFHSSIRTLLKQMSTEFIDMKYSLGNAYAMVENFMKHPQHYGFTELKYACCGNGTYNGEGPCTVKSKLCPNRDEYLFWDRYHPTQAASLLAAKILYNGGARYVEPINFKQLAEL